MSLRLLFVAVTVNAVVSQLLLRRASRSLSIPSGLPGLGRFIGSAMQNPWMYAAVSVQLVGYGLWIILLSREKLGIATAGVGSGFYVLMALSAWLVYGETLTALQWIGIALATAGVICVGLGQV